MSGALPMWQRALKRAVDIGIAFISLLLLAPLFLGITLLVLLGSGIPILQREERVGQLGRPFTLLKFRTLKRKNKRAGSVAQESASRITRVGRLLRRSRLDRLPQLWNVLRGDMSLVGPRPMAPHHLNALERAVCEALLSVRPGLTDPASNLYFAEDSVLATRPDAEAEYLRVLLPAKVRVQLNYLWHWTPLLDIRVIFQTLARLWSQKAREASMQRVRAVLATGAEAGRHRDPAPPPRQP